ncbi:pyrroline-5-carboxylate reductase [Agrobacterium sp. 22-209-1]
MAHIVLVGAGNMGFAMLGGWKAGTRHEFTVVEPDERLRERAAAQGVCVLASLADWTGPASADAIIVATKPDAVPTVVSKVPAVASNGAVVISVAAGVTIQAITAAIGTIDIGVIRSMPNTPAAIGEGMIVCCSAEAVTAAQRELAHELMSCVGKTIFIHDETLMDAVTAVSGSGPAYIFHFVEALTAAARAAGLDDETSSLLAKQTVFGAAKLMIESTNSPSELRRQVTSPKGTTEAALNILMREQSGLTALLTEAVGAAKTRSIDLRGSASK